jgi:hypothetical protein
LAKINRRRALSGQGEQANHPIRQNLRFQFHPLDTSANFRRFKPGLSGFSRPLVPGIGCFHPDFDSVEFLGFSCPL